MATISDAEWAAFRERPDEQTFAPVYEATRALAYTLCFRVTRDRELALDAFQAAYARLLAELRASPPPDFASPLQFIARLALREAWSHAKRRERRARKEFAMDELPPAFDPALAPDAQAAQRQLRERIETLVLVLPEAERLPLQLHYFHGLSQGEIAGMLEVDKSTVSRRIDKGLKRLQPLARRAGLGDALSGLASFAAIAGGAVLLEPPKAIAAAVLFANASAAATTLAAGSASLATSFQLFGGIAVKAKTILWTAAALAIFGAIAAVQTGRKQSKPVPQTATGRAVSAAETKPSAATPANVPPASRTANAATTQVQAAAKPAALPEAAASGPQATVLALVIWEGSQTPVPGTTVTLTARSATGPAYSSVGIADLQGLVRLSFPEEAQSVRLSAIREESLRAGAVFRDLRPGLAGAAPIPSRPEPVVLTLRPGATISGTVRRAEDRAPVAGMKVVARSGSGSAAGSPAESNAAGEFAVRNLPAGTFRMEAAGDFYASDPADANPKTIGLSAGGKYASLDLIVRPAGIVEGAVRDKQTSAPLSGASVAIFRSGYQRVQQAVSGEDGRFRLAGLPLGESFDISTSRSRYVAASAKVQPASGTVARVDFALQPGGRVTVLAIDGQGRPVEGASVLAPGLQSGIVAQGFQSGVPSGASFLTGADGKAFLDGIDMSAPPRIVCAKPGYSVSAANSLPDFSGGPEATMQFVLIKSETAGGIFEGTVSDASGAPIAGAAVTYGSPRVYTMIPGQSLPERVPDQTAQTGTDGRYRIEVLQTSSQARLRASAKGYVPGESPAPQSSAPDAAAKLDFTLEPGHWLAGRVLDGKGNPVAGQSVSISAVGQGGSFRSGSGGSAGASSIRTGADGRFRAEDLPGSQLQVAIRAKGYPPFSERYPADEEAEIKLRPFAALKGRVVDADTSAPIAQFSVALSTGPRAATPQVFTAPDGRFEIGDLDPAQSYALRLSSEGYPDLSMQSFAPGAPDDPERIFALAGNHAMTVRIVDAASGSAVSGATVIKGILQARGAIQWDRATDPQELFAERAQAVSGPDGSAQFADNNPSASLAVLAKGYANALVMPDRRGALLGAGGVATVFLEKEATLSGAGLQAGAPAPGLQILLVRRGAGRFAEQWEAETGAEGRYAFEGLPGGEYTVYSQQFGGDGRPVAHWQRKLAIVPGSKNSLDPGAPQGDGALYGEIRAGGKPVPGAYVSLAPRFKTDQLSQGVRSDASGAYKILGLARGSYTVQIQPTLTQFAPLSASVDIQEAVERNFEVSAGR